MSEKTKACIRCNKELPLSMFYKAKQNKDGLAGTCKNCTYIKNKKWREENKEYKKQYDKQYRENHKEELCKCAKEYRNANKEKIRNSEKQWREEHKEQKAKNDKEYRLENITERKAYEKNYRENNKEKLKQYREENKETIKIRMKKYYEDNRQRLKENRNKNRKKLSENNKKWREANPDKARTYRHMRRSIEKNLLSQLTVEEWQTIKEKFDNKCAYCGKELPLTQDHFIPLSKDGEYTYNNIIPACISCNSSKSNKIFFEWYPTFEHYSKKREEKILKHLGYSNKIQQLKVSGI